VRICLVLGLSSALKGVPDRIGYVRRAAEALVNAGHAVRVLAGADAVDAGLELDPRVGVVACEEPGPEASGYPHPAYAHAMNVRSALEGIQGESPLDAVEFSTGLGEGYFTARAKRTSGLLAGVVVAARAWIPDQVERSSRLDERLAYDAAMLDHAQLATLREADLVTTPTAALAESLAPALEHASIWGPPVLRAVGTPLEPARDAGAPLAPEAFKRLVFTGPLAHGRGCLALAQAAGVIGASIPGLAFLGPETGTGPYARPMRPLITRTLGGALHAEFSDIASAHDDDLVCVPTRADAPEATMLEQALAGRAPLVGDSAGMREPFGPAACLPADPLAFAAQLSTLLADPARVRELQRSSLDAAKAFADPKRFAESLERAFADASTRAASVPTPLNHDVASGITAVVPVFNGGRYLGQTIDAIRAQTLAPERILVVDDGSTDPATVTALSELERDGVTVLRKPNGGVGSARNLGVRSATTPLVAIIDADDLPEPAFFAKAARVLRATARLSYASTLPAMFEGDDPSTGGPRWIPLGLPGFDEDLLLCRNAGGLGGGTVFVREHLLDAGGYDETLPSYEDWDLWCRLAGRGRAGIVLPEFLVRYRVHAASKYATVGLPNHDRLKSAIIARHARPPLLTQRTLRFEFGEQAELRAGLEYERGAASSLERAGEFTRDLQARFDARDEELARSTEWNNTLQGELDRSLTAHLALEQRLASLDQDLVRSSEWNNTLQRALDAAREEVRVADERFAALDRELTRSTEWNIRLQGELDDANRAAADARERFGLMTDENLYLAQRLSAATSQLADAEAQLALVRARADDAEHALRAIDRAADARALVRENARYRAADAVNDALKRLHVQRAIKSIVRRTGRSEPAH
jgi:hypothetical protein